MVDEILTQAQISTLERLARQSGSESERRRARILLQYHQGCSTKEIAALEKISPRSVRYWRGDFQKRGMAIFSDGMMNSAPGEEAENRLAPLVGRAKEEAPVAGRSDGESGAERAQPSEVRYPRVKKRPGLKPIDPMAEAGRKVLRFQFALMLSHERGTILGEDIEELHDMRVATRRMRAAFEVFGPYFKPKVVRHHLKGLRATGRTLGRVRDLDVFMEKAGAYLAGLPESERSGLDPLLHAWQAELHVEREKLVSFLEGNVYEQFKRDFNAFVATPRAGAENFPPGQLVPTQVRHVAPILIYTHLAAVRSFESIVENAAIEQLHALRIEFKKLRYAVEYFIEVLGEPARVVVNEIKLMQDHLGNLNDADVACRILRRFIDTWEDRQLALPLHDRQNAEPVVAYLAAKHAELHHLLVTFPQAWAHFNRRELLENVAQAVATV